MIKVFHLNNDSESRIYKKDGEKYYDYRKYWGNFVTNLTVRTLDEYAVFFDPRGVKAHYLREATFKLFCKNMVMEHIYFSVSDQELTDVFVTLGDMNKGQLQKVRKVVYKLIDTKYIED